MNETEADATSTALGFQPGESLFLRDELPAVVIHGALVLGRLGPQTRHVSQESAIALRHGSAYVSASAVCTSITPKRSSSLAAFGSTSAVHSSASPAASPLRNTGAGEPVWQARGI